MSNKNDGKDLMSQLRELVSIKPTEVKKGFKLKEGSLTEVVLDYNSFKDSPIKEAVMKFEEDGTNFYFRWNGNSIFSIFTLKNHEVYSSENISNPLIFKHLLDNVNRTNYEPDGKPVFLSDIRDTEFLSKKKRDEWYTKNLNTYENISYTTVNRGKSLSASDEKAIVETTYKGSGFIAVPTVEIITKKEYMSIKRNVIDNKIKPNDDGRFWLK